MQKQFRLKKRAAFAYVYRKGEKASARDLLLLSAKSKEGLKIGLSVSKKVGNAVTRNRVKRLIREALKPLTDRIDDGFMYVIVAYPSIAEKDFFSVSKSVEQAFSRAGKLNDKEILFVFAAFVQAYSFADNGQPLRIHSDVFDVFVRRYKQVRRVCRHCFDNREAFEMHSVFQRRFRPRQRELSRKN